MLAPLAAVGLDETPHHLPGLVLGVELPAKHRARLSVADPGDDVPADLAKCYQLLSMIRRTAVQARLIGSNPGEGVKLPRDSSRDVKPVTISREDLCGGQGCRRNAVP